MKYLIFLCILITGCTSKPLSVNYYLLHTPSPILPAATHSQKVLIDFTSLTLADYLRQASLIIQLDEHELHYSRQDVWAEGLQGSFFKALKHDLNTSTKNLHVTKPDSTENVINLEVSLQHFLITNKASVISSGTYSIKLKDASWLQKAFYFTIPLEKDGYPHAVSQLRKTVTALALQINQDIQNLENN